MKLANPPCRKAKKCQPFCGMCNLSGEKRLITQDSLFGECRTKGKCVCKKYSYSDNCYGINGSRKEKLGKHVFVSDEEVQEFVSLSKLLHQLETKERNQRLLSQQETKEKLRGFSKRIKTNERFIWSLK